MDSESYVERVLSILRGGKRWDDEYASVDEFKQNLDEEDEAAWAHDSLEDGWIFWRENERVEQQQQLKQHKIIGVLQNSACLFGPWSSDDCIVQFWGVVKVEGPHHYLSTSHHPFCVGNLKKGFCRYRKLCMDHVYVVDVEEEDDEEQIIGGVRRAYRNKQFESSPDLRLYSTNEFPMCDEAALCGFRGYMALPLFDFHTNQCYGVLEVTSRRSDIDTHRLSKLDQWLQSLGLTAPHHRSISDCHDITTKKLECEITNILELAVATVPRLYLAQVWIPCNQCANINTKSCRMEMAYFISSQNGSANSWEDIDSGTKYYLEACGRCHLQTDVGSFDSNLCDVSISKNPLAHYAQITRVSQCFAISLQSVNNSSHFCIIQFFLQPTPKFREDAYGDYDVPLLLRIMEMNLKSFKPVLGPQLVKESQKAYAIQWESIDSLIMMKFSKEDLLELNFTTYLDTVDSCCLRPSSSEHGWVFGSPAAERLCENDIKEKIENFMKKIAVKSWRHNKWIVQFWAPKMVEDKCYLETVCHSYALSSLDEGIASFRKKCMTHYYFVDDQAKHHELGPPGRVFRNGHLEITPDLFHYTTDELSIKNYAMHCGRRGYFALPIFDDEHNRKCIGVLEFVGFDSSDLEPIGRELEEAKLSSTHIDFHPRFLANEQPVDTIRCRDKALSEVRNTLALIYHYIPQFHMINVWVPNVECVASIYSNMTCMELASSAKHSLRQIHVQTRKGMVGMVLASESKSCLCRNLCEFSIADQPLSHYQMSDRYEVCFAICLQSSHTGDLVYVFEFFLNRGPATYEYVRSFLNLLLPIMKHELKSFKIASGKELGEELVVGVIEFSDTNKLDSSEPEEAGEFPIKFESVQYIQKEQQHTKENQAEGCSVAALDLKRTDRGKRKTVGRSTIKRACRDYGIDRWPSKAKTHKESIPLGSVSQQDTNTETTHHVVDEEAEKVMIKVKYEEDTIKFELCLSIGLAELREEVATRLNLEMGTLKLKYLDEDGDEILLTKDVDLQLCWKSHITMGKTCIQLFVR